MDRVRSDKAPLRFAENLKGSWSEEPAAEGIDLDQRIEPWPPRATPQSTMFVGCSRSVALAMLIGDLRYLVVTLANVHAIRQAGMPAHVDLLTGRTAATHLRRTPVALQSQPLCRNDSQPLNRK